MKSQISKIGILAAGLFLSLSALSFAQSLNEDATSNSVKLERSVETNDGDTTKTSKTTSYKKTTKKTTKPGAVKKTTTKTTTVEPL